MHMQKRLRISSIEFVNTPTYLMARQVYHGDIKTENVLVTSWNWVFLVDFASYKPTYLPEVSTCQQRLDDIPRNLTGISRTIQRISHSSSTLPCAEVAT